jgi:hypothetical protein
MSLTYEQANDDIQKMITDAWSATGYPIFFESVQTDRDEETLPFIRVWVRHTFASQRTLGGQGSRIFERRGFVRIEVYSRITNGLQESYQLAKVASDAYEGRSSDNGVWFRQVRISEMGKDGAFNRTDVIVNFEYHEMK